MRLIAFALIAVCLLEAAPSRATVVHGQYCASIQFTSRYRFCPSNTTGMTWPVTCSDFGGLFPPARSLKNVQVQLWDFDNSGGDDFIGTYVLDPSTDTGGVCFNFDWDTVAHSESLPDIYPIVTFVASSTTATHGSFACKQFTASPNGVCATGDLWKASFRDDHETDCDHCDAGQLLIPDTVDENNVAMIMNSAGRWEARFGDLSGRTKNFQIAIGDPETPLPNAGCFSPTWLMISQTFKEQDWQNAPYLMTQALIGQETGTINDTRNGGDPGSGASCSDEVFTDRSDSDKISLRAGYSIYQAAQAWWFVSNTGSRPSFSEPHSTAAIDPVEDSVSCSFSLQSDNNRVPAQVARAFWDAADSRNETGESATISSATIQEAWPEIGSDTSITLNDYFTFGLAPLINSTQESQFDVATNFNCVNFF